MDYTIHQDDFSTLLGYYRATNGVAWGPLFVLPPWLEVWWRTFAPEGDLRLISVHQGGSLLGVAPLQVKAGTASLLGSSDVADYVDFAADPHRSQEFFARLLEYLRQQGIYHLELAHLRPESLALTQLVEVAVQQGYSVRTQLDEVSLEIDLPASWDDYLNMLSKKQRHEVRRKLRRLEETGRVHYESISEPQAVASHMELFLTMFRESRSDKHDYLNATREQFFRAVITTMAQWDMFRLGILKLDGHPVAMLLHFDDGKRVYLYNSGYDLDYRHLSVGVVSKVLCIRDSIERGRSVFDFLKGNEVYKYRLGGQEVPLMRCDIRFLEGRGALPAR